MVILMMLDAAFYTPVLSVHIRTCGNTFNWDGSVHKSAVPLE